MERIEVPADVYFQSKDGKKFRLQTDCEKWERLYDKWQNSVRFREFEDEDGRRCHAFWIESKEELEDALWFFNNKFYALTRHYNAITNYDPQWIIVSPYYDGYNSDYTVSTIEEFKDGLYDTLKAVQETIAIVTKLSWEKL